VAAKAENIKAAIASGDRQSDKKASPIPVSKVCSLCGMTKHSTTADSVIKQQGIPQTSDATVANRARALQTRINNLGLRKYSHVPTAIIGKVTSSVMNTGSIARSA
jgi:hypothetical protein